MNKLRILFVISLLFHAVSFYGTGTDDPGTMRVFVEWQNEKPAGTIEVLNGTFGNVTIARGKGKIRGNHFEFDAAGQNRIEILLKDVKILPGSGATLVSVQTGSHSFSFLLRDVSSDYPIWIKQYHVVVCPSGDNRSYAQIEQDISSRRLQSKLQEMDSEPEESYDSAASHTRNQKCPTLLGLSRDIRIFEIGLTQEFETIIPKMSSADVKLPESKNAGDTYYYLAGRGQGVQPNASRRLEDGILPILHSTLLDDGIEYYTTSFVTLESSPLNAGTPIGTHYLVSDSFSYGHVFTPAQKEILKSQVPEELDKSEETVLYFRAEATNTTSVPRYAFFKTIKPGVGWWDKKSYSYDRESGFSSFSTGRVFSISKLNGNPLHDEENAVLLKPGEKAVFEFRLLHSPVSLSRAKILAGQSFTDKFDECKSYWQGKLARAARIRLPEKRIEEMIQAGLLHLEMITYGVESDSILAPSVGIYLPIGTESAPIIQFYNSMGLQETARRCLMYFLDKQQDDGMIQNFGGYTGETGSVLWSIGEYYRYTHDTAWVRKIEPKLLKSCEYLLQWRNRNKKESLRGKGYGMIDGKVADPVDPFHQFMLNGYACMGINRIAETLQDIDPSNSNRLKQEAESWKQDIRISFKNSMAGSPVVPLDDGSWCPTVPPWTEARSMRMLYLNRETFLSHGTFTISDAMLGPLYLIFCEVLDPANLLQECFWIITSNYFSSAMQHSASLTTAGITGFS